MLSKTVIPQYEIALFVVTHLVNRNTMMPSFSNESEEGAHEKKYDEIQRRWDKFIEQPQLAEFSTIHQFLYADGVPLIKYTTKMSTIANYLRQQGWLIDHRGEFKQLSDECPDAFVFKQAKDLEAFPDLTNLFVH